MEPVPHLLIIYLPGFSWILKQNGQLISAHAVIEGGDGVGSQTDQDPVLYQSSLSYGP